MFTDKFQEKSAMFGGPSLNCFEVIQLFSEGGPEKAPPPDLNRVKEDYSKEQHHCSGNYFDDNLCVAM